MELRHLRYFTAVARELHFGRAAEALNMAQPPLSQQIQNLEAELGVKLFDRTRRRVELTEAGEVFLKRARVILDSADQAAVEAQRIGRGEMGRLAVGFMSAAMLDQFPPILSTFRDRLPDARVELVQMPSDEQLAGVAGGHIDVGFGDLAETAEPADVNGTRVRIETVWREELLAALPPRHRLANRPELALAELAGEPFVTLPRAPATGFYDQVIGLCHTAGFSPAIRQEASQLPAALALIASGYGVGLMPACVVQPWRDMVAFAPLKTRPSIAVTLLSRADDPSPVVAAFRDIAEAVSPGLIEAARRRPV